MVVDGFLPWQVGIGMLGLGVIFGVLFTGFISILLNLHGLRFTIEKTNSNNSLF